MIVTVTTPGEYPEYKFAHSIFKSNARYFDDEGQKTFEQDEVGLTAEEETLLQQACDYAVQESWPNMWGVWIEKDKDPVLLTDTGIEGWPLAAYKEAIDNNDHLPDLP